MAKKRYNSNLLSRARLVKSIVDHHYEPGNQRRCKLQVFRREVMKVYPMSEATFWRYLRIAERQIESDQPPTTLPLQ